MDNIFDNIKILFMLNYFHIFKVNFHYSKLIQFTLFIVIYGYF